MDSYYNEEHDQTEHEDDARTYYAYPVVDILGCFIQILPGV